MTRRLKRFYVSSSLEARDNRHQSGKEATVLLTQEETHYLKRVLRMKRGDRCLLFDRRGSEFLSCLDRVDPSGRCAVKLLRPMTRTRRERFTLSVAQSVPQHRKMDEIVRKAAELGVFELIPMVTDRTVVRMSKEREVQVDQRWDRLVAQTLQQSRIETFPQIRPMTSFQTLCAELEKFDQVFLFHPSPEARPIRDLLRPQAEGECGDEHRSVRILLLIGPEGGVTDREIKASQACGAKLVRMSTGIMKSDTAFVAATSLIRCMYE